MTREDIAKLSDEEANVLIAKLMGFTQDDKGFWFAPGKVHDWRINLRKDIVPSYCSDLNVMHEAEKTLTDDQYREWEGLVWEIAVRDGKWIELPTAGGGSIKVPGQILRATSPTARQRAEAFLATMGQGSATEAQQNLADNGSEENEGLPGDPSEYGDS